MRAATLFAPLALLCAVAGCGGDGYPVKPQQVAKAYLGTNAGSKCRFLTQRLMETLTAKQGAEARRTCERNVARFAAPKQVTLRDAKVDAHDAEIQMLRDGAEAELKMVREGDRWKIAGFGE